MNGKRVIVTASAALAAVAMFYINLVFNFFVSSGRISPGRRCWVMARWIWS